MEELLVVINSWNCNQLAAAIIITIVVYGIHFTGGTVLILNHLKEERNYDKWETWQKVLIFLPFPIFAPLMPYLVVIFLLYVLLGWSLVFLGAYNIWEGHILIGIISEVFFLVWLVWVIISVVATNKYESERRHISN